MQKKYKIVILGPQASGKGTQAEFLADKLGIPNISVGQLLRNEVEKQGELSDEISKRMNDGGLVSNAIVNELVKQRILQDDCQNGLVFDGFPRIRIQAKFLATIADISDVILVDISDDETIRRLAGRRTCLKCGKVYHIKFNPPKKQGVCDVCGEKIEVREDDTEEAIKERLKIYHTETEEVVEYYDEQGILIKINGEQSIEDVRKEIFSKLGL